MVIDRAGDADAAGFGQGFQPRGHVHPVAIDGPVLHQHIPQVDPDAELHPAVVGQFGVAPVKFPLNFHGGIDRIDDRGELGQDGVALGVHHPAPLPFDPGYEYIPVSGQGGHGAALVRAHQAGIAGHVRAEDGGQLALQVGRGHGQRFRGNAVNCKDLVDCTDLNRKNNRPPGSLLSGPYFPSSLSELRQPPSSNFSS